MFVADLKTGILADLNPAAESLSGYTREELLGQHFTRLHPEAEHEAMRHAVEKAAFPRPILNGLHLLRKDGASVPVSISSSAPFESEGRSMAVGIYRDVSELMEREHLLATQNWALSAYASASLALGQARSSESLLQAICVAITQDPAYLLAWVGIAEDDPEKRIRIAASAGQATSFLEGLHLSWSEDQATGKGPTGTCIRTNTLQIVEDAPGARVIPSWVERARKMGIHSSVCIPFSVERGWRGALVIYSFHYSAFSPTSIKVFEQLAGQLSRGVYSLDQEQRLHKKREQLGRAERQLGEALSALVAPMISAMELRDPYTVGHQSRVAEIACDLGREMGWPENRLRGMRLAAMVHDIGKISVPAEFLTKPHQLSPAEQAMVNTHSETGYTILKGIPFPWPVAEIVRQHHERVDGTGFPLGLKGDAILLEARVLAVADTVEAMSSYRPYRATSKIDAVLKEIERRAGSQLDAEVVRVCLSLFRKKGYLLPSANIG